MEFFARTIVCVFYSTSWRNADSFYVLDLVRGCSSCWHSEMSHLILGHIYSDKHILDYRGIYVISREFGPVLNWNTLLSYLTEQLWKLHSAKRDHSFGRTNRMISRLIRLTVETGTVTATSAAMELILFEAFQSTNLHFAMFVPMFYRDSGLLT